MKYIHLPNGTEPPALIDCRHFKAIVLIEDNVNVDWQYKISNWLIISGCYYMMAWGNNCSSWDDSVDLSLLKIYSYGDIPDEKYVMTAWHENDSRSHVFWFCENCAHHDYFDSKETVIVDITKDGREMEITDEFNAAQQGDAPEPASPVR